MKIVHDSKLRETGIIILALLLIPVIFSSSAYLLLLLCTIGISAIAVTGLDILFGYSGQISLGHASFYAIGAYTSAILSTRFGIPFWFTSVIGAFLAAVIGLLIALPSVKLVHHFLALVTISFGQLVYLFVTNADRLTNGFEGINFIPKPQIGSFLFDSNISYFYMILFFAVLLLFVKQRIIYSKFGRAFTAIKENTHAANGMGIWLTKYKVMAFSISAFYTGFAGALYAHFIGFISPESFMYSQSVLFLTMLLFGGMGNLYGPILGTIALTILSEQLQAIGSYQTIVYGIILLLVILFLPTGLSGINLFRKLKRRVTDAEA
jgi:branched-chain amino acid transport system permease protein